MATLPQGALAVLAIAASACRISTGFGVARPAATTSATATTDPPASERRSPADDPRIIFRDEMASLPGLTVEQARRRLAEYGHVGKVTIEELGKFDPGCQPGTVCSTSDPGGSFVDAEIVLRINKAKLAIPGPPP